MIGQVGLLQLCHMSTVNCGGSHLTEIRIIQEERLERSASHEPPLQTPVPSQTIEQRRACMVWGK